MKKIKSLLGDSCLIALVGILFWLPSFAADTGNINASVSAKNSAISVSNGTVNYGAIAWSGTANTVTLAQTQVATNQGSAGTFNVKSSQATGGTGWTMANSTGIIDQFVHQFSTTTGATYVQFDTNPNTYKTATTTVAYNSTQNIDLRIYVPSSTTDFGTKSITVTVQAVAD